MSGGGAETAWPLFKGATRAAVVWGVPLVPLLGMLMGVATLALAAGLLWWGLAPVLWAAMAQITRHDDRAFRIWRLAAGTVLRNRNRAFWGASSYSPVSYRRWEA